MAEELKFVAVDHTYWIGDHELISLTKLLEVEGIIDTRFYTGQGALRGTTVHLATKLLDLEGGYNVEKMPKQWLGYVDAWERFKGEVGFVVQETEYRTCNQALGVACTIDRIGGIPDGSGYRWIVELKTGAHEEWHWLQLAGQRECVDFACQVAVVYLREDGGYTFLRRDFSQHLRDRKTFRAAVEMVEWKRRYARGLRER